MNKTPINLEQISFLGLNQKQAEIFMACLKLGAASATQISRKAGVKRTSFYHLMDTLIQKKLVIKQPYKSKILYKTRQPKQILDLLDNQRKKLKQLMPVFESLYNNSQWVKPKIEFYEGKGGLLEAYQKIFTTSKTIHSFISYDNFFQIMSWQQLKKLFTLLQKNGGKILDLTPHTPKAESLSQWPHRKGIENIKYLPNQFKVFIDMIVVGHKVAFFSFKSLVAVIIEDKDIAALHKQFFKHVWQTIS